MKHYNIYSFYSSYSTLMHSNHQLRLAAWNNPSQTGKKIKNFIYQYSDIIGKGNFAKVYKGLNLNTQQVLAIKLISLDQLKSKHLETLVFEEIRILQLMNHPNILKFHEALLSERNCYIVTELCNQGSLEDRIKSKVPISEEQLGSIIFDLYNGLKYLREKGVTHRDFKPANIFVHNGQLRIADFGLAKLYKQRFHDLDIGSPHYMSPEGLILNNYSQKTDIWSLGITIYQLLHGITPFAQCQSQQQLVYNITRPIPEHKWRKDINPLLRQFINKLLEIEQLKRPNIYQLYNQPYMRLVVQRQNDKNQQIKLTQSISLCSYSASQESQKKLRNSLSINPFVNQPPNAEKMANINQQHKIQNQRLYSTTSSQNSSRSARNIQLQNSMNFSVKYPSYNNIQHNENPRFSFAKLNQSAKIIVPTQKNQILMTSASIKNRTFNQLPERTAYLENKQSNVYRMQCQQVVPIQNQLLFAHQRQKAVVLQVNSLQNQKRQYPSTLYPRPNNYFY